jgi:hypothetical protein
VFFAVYFLTVLSEKTVGLKFDTDRFDVAMERKKNLMAVFCI